MQRSQGERLIGRNTSGPLRFGVVASDPRWLEAVESLVGALAQRGVALVSRPVATYAALYEAMDGGACELAWAPPLIALDLARCAAALPVARPVRAGQSVYYAVILGGEGRRGSLEQCRGSRMAWVAPESAAGYLVPRLGLESLGLPPDRLFGAQAFFGSHAAAVEALRSGVVEFAATHATLAEGHFQLAPSARGLSIVAAYGPIPSDVIVVSTVVAPSWQHAFGEALESLDATELERLGEAVELDHFELTNASHLRSLDLLGTRSDERVLRTFAPSSMWS